MSIFEFGDKKIDDPIYEGKLISYWISDLQGHDSDVINATNTLIRAGSIAIPQLIRGFIS